MAELKSRVQSAGKVFTILEALANSPKGEMGISDLASTLDWNRTTVYRFIQTLIDEGYVRLVADKDRYCLTFKIVELANKMVNRIDIRKIAQPYLIDLVEKWRVNAHLAMIDDNEIVFIDRIDHDKLLGTKFHIGRRSPVHATAIGKVILSTWDSKALDLYLRNYQFVKYSPNTLTDKDVFLQELGNITSNGYAFDQGEFNYDVYCIAAPLKDINGETIAGISLSGSEKQISQYALNEIGEAVREAAQKISLELGYGKG